MIQIPETITFFFSHRKDLLTFLLNSRSVQKIHLKLPWENENKNNKIIPSATGKFPLNPCNFKICNIFRRSFLCVNVGKSPMLIRK